MKQKDLLLLLVPFFLILAAWIIFNIYHSSVTSTISDSLNIQITPIDPSFDQAAIESIKNRDNIAPVYDLLNTQVASPSPTTQTPAATDSGTTLQLEPNESSSEGEQQQ